MDASPDSLPPSTDDSGLGICHLRRFWARTQAQRRGVQVGAEPHLDKLLVHALGLGWEPTLQVLFKNGPSLEDFLAWIEVNAGTVDPLRVARFNAAVRGEAVPDATQAQFDALQAMEPVLAEEDLALWRDQGFVVLPQAAPAEAIAQAAQALWDHLGADPADPESWYRAATNGIMVQLFRHPALDRIHASARIHKAFAQLWGSPDLWMTTDRCGFNVPVRHDRPFPGPDLHWDVSLHLPMPFGTQGILYLEDTPPEQGALTLVPAFQHRLAPWLASLPPGANPRTQDLHALGSRPIPGQAGDLVIWHHALPHGSRPNLGARPRLVHYLDMVPFRMEIAPAWV
jgi:hypothetical protein